MNDDYEWLHDNEGRTVAGKSFFKIVGFVKIILL